MQRRLHGRNAEPELGGDLVERVIEHVLQDHARALLADDVRLDLVAQRKAAGRRAVGGYFSNYERTAGWRVAPGWFDGREAMAVWADAGDAPSYVVALDWRDGRVAAIRDFRYARYVMIDGRFEAEREHTA